MRATLVPIQKPAEIFLSGVVFFAYFGVLLTPNIWPHVATNMLFIFYILSLVPALIFLVVMGSWGFFGWIFTRNKVHLQKLALSGIGAATFFACVGIDQFVSGGLPPGSNSLKFDSKLWKQTGSMDSNGHDPSPRQQMLLDLVRNVLPGRSKQEIEGLLGSISDAGVLRSNHYDLIYCTGLQRDSLFSIDSEWLMIWLDQNGKFKSYNLASD